MTDRATDSEQRVVIRQCRGAGTYCRPGVPHQKYDTAMDSGSSGSFATNPQAATHFLIFICIRNTQQQHIYFFVMLFMLRDFSYNNETDLNSVSFPKKSSSFHQYNVKSWDWRTLKLKLFSEQKLPHMNTHLPKGFSVDKKLTNMPIIMCFRSETGFFFFFF